LETFELPYGGFKESGFGRDRSLLAIEKYSDLKNIIIRTAR
jgi:acyl-CoA reductase-like NAD-dependent aldehyde dehydrogenase